MKKKKVLLKSNVISFRLTTAQKKKLEEVFKRQPVSYVKSEKSLCRKWVCDFLEGRLKFANPKHALVDLDIHAETSAS